MKLVRLYSDDEEYVLLEFTRENLIYLLHAKAVNSIRYNSEGNYTISLDSDNELDVHLGDSVLINEVNVEFLYPSYDITELPMNKNKLRYIFYDFDKIYKKDKSEETKSEFVSW